jgi:hypothetical protein
MIWLVVFTYPSEKWWSEEGWHPIYMKWKITPTWNMTHVFLFMFFCLNNCKITLELRKPSQMIRLSNKMCVTNIGIWFNQNWSLTNNHDKHGHLKPSQTNHINQNNISWWFVDPCLFCWTLREICGVLLTKLSELGPDLPTSDSSGGTVCELENGPVASLIYHDLPIKSGDFQ